MTAQKGKDLLLKIDTDGLGTFTTVAGLRSQTIAFNAESVDITHQESAGHWRELLAGAGVKSTRISGSGVFKDEASDELIRSAFFNGSIKAWQIVIPDFGQIQGLFHIASFELSGRHDGEVAFDLGLESAGALDFTGL